MADETCPYCKEPLPDPRSNACPHCGKSISEPDRKFPMRIALGFVPAVLIGLSPLYLTWILGPDEYGEDVLAINLFILGPFTLIYMIGWALSFHRNNPDTDVPWFFIGFLMVFLNFAIGIGGCLMVYGMEAIS